MLIHKRLIKKLKREMAMKINYKIFCELEETLKCIEESFINDIKCQKKIYKREVISKGAMYNIYPFEAERAGKKLNGKVIDEIIMNDNCFIYYFDEENRVRLIENMSKFLKKMYYYRKIDYTENGIISFYCNCHEVINVSKAIMKNGRVDEIYRCTKEKKRYEKYIYENEKLIEIHIFFIKEKEIVKTESNQFYYNKGKLEIIQRKCTNGYTENIYAEKKLSYKQIEYDMEEKIKNSIQLFGNRNVDMTAMGIKLMIDDLNPIVNINFEVNKMINDLVEEWSFGDWDTIEIANVPLDKRQQDKIIKITKGILEKLLKHNVIKKSVEIRVIKDDEII